MDEKPLSDLQHPSWNPRRISDFDFKNLKQSIREFGDLSGVVKNIQTGHLVGGNQRLEAFKALGASNIIITHHMSDGPTAQGTVAHGYIVMPNGEQFGYREVLWPEEREKAANIAANRIQGEWDNDLLAQVDYELSQLDNGTELLASTGQGEDEISRLLDTVGVGGEDPADEEVPEVDEANPPVSKLGEIYQLGRHRLMCGDSTDFGAASDLMDGTVPNLVFTDPPYNAAFNGRSGNHDVIMNDKLPAEEFKSFIQSFMQTMYAIAPDAPKYICTDWKMYPLIYSLMAKPSACIVWVKNMFGMGNGYRHQHELIVFEGSLETHDQSDVWEIKRDNGAEYDHPTQKPIAIPQTAILNSSKRGEAVLDLFGGSGPTVIAAERTGRTAYIMELDPKYCDVIRKRYAKHIGQEANWEQATVCINAVVPENEPASAAA